MSERVLSTSGRATRRCVYCLSENTELTDDHVIPRAWYPDTTLGHVERWTAPACDACNQAFSRIDQRLLVRFALCLPPDAPETAGLPGRALRSLKPDRGRNLRDADKRRQMWAAITAELAPPTPELLRAAFPGFGLSSKLGDPPPLMLRIGKDDLDSFVQRVVVGGTYFLDRVYVDPRQQIEPLYSYSDDAIDVRDLLDRFGTLFELGPGVRLRRARPHDAPTAALWEIVFWGRLTAWATLDPRASEREPTPPS